MVVVMLALPACQGDDKPKDEKKPQTPKEQYDSLTKEFGAEQQKIIAEAQKTKGEEQQKLYQKYLALNKDYSEKIFKIAEDNSNDPVAKDALLWVIRNGGVSPVLPKAIDLLVDKFPSDPAIEQVCKMLAMGRVPDSESTLKKIAEKSPNKHVKAVATLAIGQAGVSKAFGDDDEKEADKAAAEAEKSLTDFISTFGKDEPNLKKTAERSLASLNHCRVGKTAADITGPDLDGKDFKLSDYRGKVVLLDFWGNW